MADKASKLKDMLNANVLKRGSEIASPPPRKDNTAPEISAPRPEKPAAKAPEESPVSRKSIRATLERHQAAMPRIRNTTEEAYHYEPIAETQLPESETCAQDIELVIPGEVIPHEDSEFYLIRRDFPLDYMQGRISLGKALEVDARHIAFSSLDDSLGSFDPRKAVFVDTETSGLAGGAGTVTFLVGAGYFHEDMFRLDQCFMRDYDDEAAMLHYLATLFERFDTVVSYNGKSFDLPLLRTRFIQHRIPPRVTESSHFDLVHAARRIWKLRLRDCSLGNVEREVLDIERTGDIPSYLIPQLWLQYLNHRNARPLEGVFYHHQMDILSLAALTGWLSQCLETPDALGFDCMDDRQAILRLQVRQKQYTDAIQTGQTLLQSLDSLELRKSCLELIAQAAKRCADWEQMTEALEQLIEEIPESIDTRIELAKHYEHRARDLESARQQVQECLTMLDTGTLSDSVSPYHGERYKAALEKRLARLQRKLPDWEE